MMKLVLCVLLVFILLKSLVPKVLCQSTSSDNSTSHNGAEHHTNRTFRVDFDKNQFLKDDKPFQFVSGQFDYFHAVPKKWRHIMRTMRAAGVNVLATYVPWSTHNPHDGEFVWTGLANVDEFIRIATEEGFLIILRISPYIGGERTWGGVPYWLLSKYPNIKIRSLDPDFTREVRKWYAILMPRFSRYLYGNGGPVIMVQVENEYGVYGCDSKYMEWIRDETRLHVGDKAALFSNDVKFDRSIRCGHVDGILEGSDFEVATDQQIDSYWQILRKYQPKGPLFNAEFYMGWPTNWGEARLHYQDTNKITQSLRYMLKGGASVNIYMFFGGTQFGLTVGSNTDFNYRSDVTSYDYDAPIDEAGDVTPKYYAIRDVIKDFWSLPNITVPPVAPKMQPPSIKLRPRASLFSTWARAILGSDTVKSKSPQTFEQINQDTGFVLYETMLPESVKNPSTLRIPKVYDLSKIYINNTMVGSLTRNDASDSIQIKTDNGRLLQILVENEGRRSYGMMYEFRGIIGDVFLNDKKLENWTMTGFPFSDDGLFNHLMNVLPYIDQEPDLLKEIEHRSADDLTTGPIIFQETFDINDDEIHDTYIDPSGWGKGFIVINGFNLGRHWPLAGPQITLYVPKEILVKKGNSIVVFEQIKAPTNGEIKFSSKPINSNH